MKWLWVPLSLVCLACGFFLIGVGIAVEPRTVGSVLTVILGCVFSGSAGAMVAFLVEVPGQ
jgi:hypothetical protein